MVFCNQKVFGCVIGCDSRWEIDMAGPQKDKYGRNRKMEK